MLVYSQIRQHISKIVAYKQKSINRTKAIGRRGPSSNENCRRQWNKTRTIGLQGQIVDSNVASGNKINSERWDRDNDPEDIKRRDDEDITFHTHRGWGNVEADEKENLLAKHLQRYQEKIWWMQHMCRT